MINVTTGLRIARLLGSNIRLLEIALWGFTPLVADIPAKGFFASSTSNENGAGRICRNKFD